ncbi:hypothetical protein [Clostridium butyricum]|uniref:hypothetical protein n=1 Tax=Clostridium butyricum TaxID=1492 RepID=UPI00374E3FAB
MDIKDIKNITSQEYLYSMQKQMKQALDKGIVPGAIVLMDGDFDDAYTIFDLRCAPGWDFKTCGPVPRLEVLLKNKNSSMNFSATSERLKVFTEEQQCQFEI